MAKIIQQFMTKMMVVPLLSIGISGLVVSSVYAADCTVDSDNPLGTASECVKNDSQPTDLTKSIQDITNVLLFVVGAISVIMIIYGGIQYVTSSGDSSKVQNAKNTILYSIVGIVVAILAYAITNFVVSAFINH